MNLRDKAVLALTWSAALTWGERAISFLVFLFLVRHLEPEAFGLVALALVFVGFAKVLLDQGFGDAIVQREQLEPEHLDTAFWIGIVTAGVLTGVGVATAGLVAGLFDEPRLALVIRWLSASFLFRALSNTQQTILRRDLAFKSLAIRSLTAAIVGGGVGVTLAWLGYGVWSIVGQILSYRLVEAVVLWQVSEWRPGRRVTRRHFDDLFMFSVHIFGAKAVDSFGRRAPDLLVGAFLGPVALGYYVVAYRLIRVILRLLTGVTNLVAFPLFSRLQSEPARMRHIFYQATQFTSLVAFPTFLGLLALAPELVPVVFGDTWTASIPVLQILVLLGVLQSVSQFNGSVIKAAGKPSWRFGITLFTTIANVVVILLVVRSGIVTVAVASVLVGYATSPASLLAVRKLIQIEIGTYLRQYLVPLGGSLTMVAMVVGVRFVLGDRLGLHLQLLVFGLTGVLTYLLFIQSLAPSLYREARALIRPTVPVLFAN